MNEYDELWRCAWEDCHRWYPVPSMARDCEERHLAEEDEHRKSLKSSA